MVQFGWRSIIHSTGGNSPISTIYSGSTSRLTGLNLRNNPCRSVSVALSTRPTTLNSLTSSESPNRSAR